MADPSAKPMSVEERFTAFVRWFGGEVIEDLLPRGEDLPKNADYFLFARTVVAELKCLEKDYFRAQDVGRKFTKLANRWLRDGSLRPEHIIGGRFSTAALPERCALQALEIFAKPLREAVTDANTQLKATKLHFGVPNARGLVILANDGNYSLNPDLAMGVLARLFKNRFSAIDSFIYFAPDMEVSVPGLAKPARVWISGPTRDPASGVTPDHLARMSSAWIEFTQSKTGEPVEAIAVTDHDLVQSIEFTRREVP